MSSSEQILDAVRLCLRLARFLPLLIVPILANWTYNQKPVQRHLATSFDQAASLLIAGTSIWSSGDLRPLKAAWMLQMPARKDILILGSSRALQISENWFQPQTTFNAAVPHGGLDDMIAFFELSVEAGKTPRAVLLELNPTLRSEQEQGDHRLLTPYFNRALERFGVFNRFRHLMDLSSLRQFRLNLQRLQPPAWGRTPKPFAQMAQILPDGTAIYEGSQSSANASDMDVASQVRHTDREKVRWRTSSHPSPGDLNLLRCFLDDLRSRRVEVVILLPPIHPIAYEFYSKLGGYDDTWIRREMASRSIPVVGSYSPAIAKAAATDFFDDVHPHPALVHRLLHDAGVANP